MENLNQENNDCSNVQRATAAVPPPNEDQKKNKSIFQLICPLLLPNLDLNQGPSD